jgi:hypothetical protein
VKNGGGELIFLIEAQVNAVLTSLLVIFIYGKKWQSEPWEIELAIAAF